MKKKNTQKKNVKLHVRRGDNVIVIAGNHKGEQGTITQVDVQKQRVIIEGLNIVMKHIKPSASNPEGGIIEMEAPIHISNVAHVDPKSGTATRIGRRLEENDKGEMKLVRYSKKSGEII